jgi:hypothetical protein
MGDAVLEYEGFETGYGLCDILPEKAIISVL